MKGSEELVRRRSAGPKKRPYPDLERRSSFSSICSAITAELGDRRGKLRSFRFTKKEHRGVAPTEWAKADIVPFRIEGIQRKRRTSAPTQDAPAKGERKSWRRIALATISNDTGKRPIVRKPA